MAVGGSCSTKGLSNRQSLSQPHADTRLHLPGANDSKEALICAGFNPPPYYQQTARPTGESPAGEPHSS
jgi:hypothetical protein